MNDALLWLTRFSENKDHLINKIDNLSDEQKNTVIDHFKKYPHKENLIDWNKYENLTWSDFDTVIRQRSKTKKKGDVKKRGVRGLAKDEDYTIVMKRDSKLIVMPHSWEASKLLASKYVGGVEGKWCTAYQKDDEPWYDYVKPETHWYEGRMQVFTPQLFYGIDFESKRKIAIIYCAQRRKGLLELQPSIHPLEMYDEKDNLIKTEVPSLLLFLYPDQFKGVITTPDGLPGDSIYEIKRGSMQLSLKAKMLLTYIYDQFDEAAINSGYKVRRSKQPEKGSEGRKRTFGRFDVWSGDDLDASDVVWQGGTFVSGKWLDGEWLEGMWLGGDWINGTWHDGRWQDGIWHNGTWLGGEWDGGTWLDGDWRQGWILDKERKGNFDKDAQWHMDRVFSIISPKEYFNT